MQYDIHQTPAPPEARATRSIWSRLSFVIAGVSAVVCIAIMVLSYVYLQNLGVFSLDDAKLKPVINNKFSDNSIVYDRSGNKIGEYYDHYQIYVRVKHVPKLLINAIVATEDQNFWKHKGFDPKGIARATWVRIKTGKTTQGASTITQQVVRHLLLSREKSVERKILEIAWARRLEKITSKAKIMEIYLNAFFLGNGTYGVAAAAQRYFGKVLPDLTLAESALIAGLFQSPSRYNPMRFPERAKKRQQFVLKAMLRSKYISTSQYKAALAEPLNYVRMNPSSQWQAPFFLDYVREELSRILNRKSFSVDGKGLRIYTTLDMNMQRATEQSIAAAGADLKHAERFLPKTQKLEAAALVVDSATGDILSMVGGRNYNQSQFNRASSAVRSPGSAFKPVVYTQALIKGWKWSDIILVSPVNIGNYKPHTPEEDFGTETTLLRAFYRSMNTPTVELANKLGLAPVLELAKRLGIKSPIKEEFGSTLGSSDTSMFDLARLYGVYANQGELVDINAITKVTDASGELIWSKGLAPPVKVLTPQISYLMTEGMRSVLSLGTGSRSSDLAQWAAGKTGTSNNSADNWFCGYTASQITSIVWVGTDDHAPLFGNSSGGSLALPIWDRIIRKTTAMRPMQKFKAPPGISVAKINPRYGTVSGGGETMFFLDSNRPSKQSSSFQLIEERSAGSFRGVYQN